MTLEQTIKAIHEAIAAAEYRKQIEHFTEEKNLYELKVALDYVMNPTTKQGKTA